ncbi:helix-turn-helix transcriptional regulator [Bacillus pseudomycoides]|uniref:helix-turn-helix transcriptional regulator n=1 Tax=Bacillus pseudomycoides TaxID=64104 RepID=UPI0023DB265D|nr:winged helix-turn-helix domain-containing protein [Bacillus pseudomycoides]MDF2083819.1 winged helix-turn-helix domain-containing protein [Bacillus pseudomycoides]
MNLQTMTGQELMENGYTLQSPAQRERYEDYNKVKKGNEQFVMVKDNFTEVKAHLSLEQSGVLSFLLVYAKLNEEGQLFIEKNRKLEKMTVSDVAEVIGKTPKQTKRILDELEKLNLIERTKEGRNVFVSLSEQFFNCGAVKDSEKFARVYKTRLAELAKQVSLNELGLFMKVISHMHYKYYVLCDNPNEMDSSQVTIWQRKEIMTELNLSADFVRKTIAKLIKIRAIAEVKYGRLAGFILSPSLVSKELKRPSLDEIADFIEGEGVFSSANFNK